MALAQSPVDVSCFVGHHCGHRQVPDRSSRHGIFRRIDDVFEDLLMWFAVAWLFTTFFQGLLAALTASLISLVLMKFLLDWLEKHPPREHEEMAQEAAAESGL